MKTIFAAAAIAAFLVTPALAADDCATTVGKIDEAMKTATVDEATKAKLTSLVEKAKAEGEKGEADACAATTKEAMTLLGM
jgi:hypothetical protein